MIKKILFIIILLFCPLAYSNPSPFGLEINKTSLDEAKKQYKLINEKINYYSKGSMYNIDPNELSLDGLDDVLLIFSEKDQVLLEVIATFRQYRFDSLNKNLSQKYELVKQNTPLIGGKYVVYRDDQSFITLSTPSHLVSFLNLTYISKEFNSQINEIEKLAIEKKNKNELDSL